MELADAVQSNPILPHPVWVAGIPLHPFTTRELLESFTDRIRRSLPTLYVTANVNYAMLCENNRSLQQMNRSVGAVLADGMPLIWLARLMGKRIPERITGADLLLRVCQFADAKQYRLFFLGGYPGQVEEAACQLRQRFPNLQIAGTHCPPFGKWSSDDEIDIVETVRSTRPDILLAAFTQPRGELWLAKHLHSLQVSVCLQIGGWFDFVTNRVRRAPSKLQRLGLEWFFRFLQEPRRLGSRYLRNLHFLGRMTLGCCFSSRNRRQLREPVEDWKCLEEH